MTTLFGISNCDTVRAARRWLDEHGVEYRFHDFRKNGLTAKLLGEWLQRAEAGQLLNRRSRTWRELSEKDKQDVEGARATRLLQAHPTLIKRPVLQHKDQLIVGFDEPSYKKLFG